MKKYASIILALVVIVILVYLCRIKNLTTLNYPKYFPSVEYDLSKNPIDKDKIE